MLKNKIFKILFLSLFFCIISHPIIASAYQLFGGKWDYPSQLYYYKDSSVNSHGYGTHTDYGAKSWSNYSSKVNLNARSSGYVDIKVYAGDINKPGVYADALNYVNGFTGIKPSWTGTYVASVVRINDPVMSKYGQTVVNGVMAHEFGHVLGIDHSGDPWALMHAENSNWFHNDDDIAAVRAIYGK